MNKPSTPDGPFSRATFTMQKPRARRGGSGGPASTAPSTQVPRLRRERGAGGGERAGQGTARAKRLFPCRAKTFFFFNQAPFVSEPYLFLA